MGSFYGYRMFGKKAYSYKGFFNAKSDANNKAKDLKCKGLLVRITKGTRTGGGYDVWATDKRKQIW